MAAVVDDDGFTDIGVIPVDGAVVTADATVASHAGGSGVRTVSAAETPSAAGVRPRGDAPSDGVQFDADGWPDMTALPYSSSGAHYRRITAGAAGAAAQSAIRQALLLAEPAASSPELARDGAVSDMLHFFSSLDVAGALQAEADVDLLQLMDEATAEATTVIAPAVDASAVQGGGVADTSPVAPEAPVSAPAKQHGVTPAGASPVRSAPSSAVASMPRHTIASAMAAAAAADPIPAASATEPFALSGSSAAAAGSASVPQQLPATAAAAAPLAGDAVGAVEPTARTWVIGSRLPTAESLPFSPELSRMLLASLHQVVADCTVASEPSLSVNDVRDIDEMYAEFTGSV